MPAVTPVAPTSLEESLKEKVARSVHRMTTSGVSFESFSRARTHELFGCAAAGVVLALNVSREKAEEMLFAAVA